MKKGLTELVFILDQSGSMSGLEKDTIGGFNSMLQKQKELVTGFDEDLWYSLIEYVTVFNKEDIRFTFKDGTEIKV